MPRRRRLTELGARIGAIGIGASLAACGPAGPTEPLPSVTLAELRSVDVGELAAAPAAERFVSADLRRGEKLFRQCVVCHAIEPGVTIGQGPSLNGVWGRASAAVPGFAYSSALAAADIKWSVRAMDAWVAQPLRLVPGSQMSFGGLHAKRDRNDLLAYMLADERFWDEAER